MKYILKVYRYNDIYTNQIHVYKEMYFEEYGKALSYGQSELRYVNTAGFIIIFATDNSTLLCVERKDIIQMD